MLRLTQKLSVAAAATLVLSVTAVGSALAHTSAAAAAASAKPVHLLSCAGAKLTRPTGAVTLACADDGIAINHTGWSSWGSKDAVGVTDLEINLCQPTCVASRTSSFKHSRVRLYDVVQTKARGAVFTRAAITYRHAGKNTTVIAYPRS